jgi:hypothetical protein
LLVHCRLAQLLLPVVVAAAAAVVVVVVLLLLLLLLLLLALQSAEMDRRWAIGCLTPPS